MRTADATSCQTVVIWNPGSGGGANNDSVRQEIQRTPDFALKETCSLESVRREICHARESHARRIVAAGGDGTVNAVASVLQEMGWEDVEFAVLPLGTGNDFARTLHIPLNPAEAIKVIRNGRSRPANIVRVSSEGERDRWALNMVTGGNTGKYAHTLTDEQKKRWGPFCYLGGVLDILTSLDVFQTRWCIDGGSWKKASILNLFVANGRTSGGGLTVAPTASVDDGLLDLILIHEGSATDLAELAMEYALADFLSHELVEHHRARTIEFVGDRIPMSTDGDAIGDNSHWTMSCETFSPRVIFGPNDE